MNVEAILALLANLSLPQLFTILLLTSMALAGGSMFVALSIARLVLGRKKS
jgi:hypothetical protein